MEYEPTSKHLDPEVIASLRNSEVSRNDTEGDLAKRDFVLRLPAQLDPKIYQKVDKVLKTCGGNWKKSLKGHLFSSDPTPMLEVILETGCEPANNPMDYFPTPKSVCDTMLAMSSALVAYGDPDVTGSWLGHDLPILLEPSAGQGHLIKALLAAAPAWAGRIEAVEANRLNAAVLTHLARETGAFRVHETNFLDWQPTPGRHPRMAFMNPPFTYKGNTTAYIDHILHAWNILMDNPDPHGDIHLVSVCPTGWLGRRRKREAELFDLVATYGGNGGVERCLPGAFWESGTQIDTAIIHLQSEGRGKGKAVETASEAEELENQTAHALALYLDNTQRSQKEAQDLAKAGPKEWLAFLSRWQITLAQTPNPVCLPVSEVIASKVKRLMVEQD